MGSLFDNVDRIARHVLSGFVALAVVWAIGDLGENNCVLKAMKTSTGSWWPVLLLAPVIGCLVYAVHTAIYFTTWGYLLFWLALRQKELRHNPSESIWVKKDRYNQQRWVRRVSEKPEIRAVQTSIDAWAAQTHLLYCSAWAIALTTIALSFTPELEFEGWALVPAVLLAGLALLSDYRAMRYSLRVQMELHKCI